MQQMYQPDRNSGKEQINLSELNNQRIAQFRANC
jgi:hypothetical protein